MDPESKKLRKLEAYVQHLEAENRALRAELNKGNAQPIDSCQRDANAKETFRSGEHDEIIQPVGNLLSPEAKITLFKSRFSGRTDLYARRWEGRDSKKKGYSPVCANEWREGVCKKPKIRCHDCNHRAFEPITDGVIRKHLTGAEVVGLYPLDAQSCCRFIVSDFDHDGWQDDTRALILTCRGLDIPALPEISRSGDGAHVWFFFNSPVAAGIARRFVTALIERTCREERLLSLSSHDRLIPNQDVLTGAGFGSLVALPLQKSARERGATVFVDDDLVPVADPWQALEDIPLIGAGELDSMIERIEDGHGGAALHVMEDIMAPWRRSNGSSDTLTLSKLDLPTHLSITLSDGVYVDRLNLPQPLLYAIARLAAFPNPHWHELERVHRSTWNIARFVDKSRLLARYVRLPRGCWDELISLLSGHSIEPQISDERNQGTPLPFRFSGELRSEQKTALKALISEEVGVLHAPPGFGKTVTAAAVISKRGRSTLVIVHTTDLLRQWQSRLAEFLSVEKKDIGTLGGGRKRRLTGKLDIAGVRSLAKLDDEALVGVLKHYGQIIVDECHHAGAASHTRVLEVADARYVLGLTATPKRRDGLEPVVFMNCGQVRHRVSESESTTIDQVLEPLEWRGIPDTPPDGLIQDVLSAVADDVERTRMIAAAVVESWRQGRKVLVLTERRGHIDGLLKQISEIAGDALFEPFVLHGKLTSRVRRETVARLDALDENQPRCLVATGKLIGEGFDHPPLDTVVFAMPFAWRGTLQQYLGRLARASKGKQDVRVIDVHDTGHPMLESMWRKRQRGYRALGWRVATKRDLF